MFWPFKKLLIGGLIAISFLSLTYKSAAKDSYLAEFGQLGVKTIYYDVNGQSASEVRAALNKYGPVDKNGRRGDAYTAWKISWKWGFENGQPDFFSTQVAHEISVTLPNWLEYESAPVDLKNNWNSFITAIVKHERQHIEHVLKHKDIIRENIVNAYQQNPTLTQDQANALAREVLARIRNLDRTYDLTTLHGRTEGVRFP